MKEQIVNLCNRELARRPAAPEGDAATGEGGIEKEAQDLPLVRGYNFLRTFFASLQRSQDPADEASQNDWH